MDQSQEHDEICYKLRKKSVRSVTYSLCRQWTATRLQYRHGGTNRPIQLQIPRP